MMRLLLWSLAGGLAAVPPAPVQLSRRVLTAAAAPRLRASALSASPNATALLGGKGGLRRALPLSTNESAVADAAAVPIATRARAAKVLVPTTTSERGEDFDEMVADIQSKIVLVRHKAAVVGNTTSLRAAAALSGADAGRNASRRGGGGGGGGAAVEVAAGDDARAATGSSGASAVRRSGSAATDAAESVLAKTKSALNLAQGTTDKLEAVAQLGEDVNQKLASIAAGIKSLETMDAIEHVGGLSERSRRDERISRGRGESKNGLLTTASGHLDSARASRKRANLIVAVEKAERAGLNETISSAKALVDQSREALLEVVASHKKQTAELKSLRKAQRKSEFEHAVQDELLKQVESKAGLDFEDGKMKLDIDAAVVKAASNIDTSSRKVRCHSHFVQFDVCVIRIIVLISTHFL